MGLEKLSDEDLDRLYYDSKAGFRKGTDYSDNDGDDVGGYSKLDFYTGQTASSDYEGPEQGEQDDLMELSQMYRDNVFTDYEGGAMSDKDYRKGFESIYREKDRRRVKYIDDGRYKPPAEEEAKPEVKEEEIKVGDRPKREPVNVEELNPYESKDFFAKEGTPLGTTGKNPNAFANDPEPAKEGKIDYNFQAAGQAKGKAQAVLNSNPAAAPAPNNNVFGETAAPVQQEDGEAQAINKGMNKYDYGAPPIEQTSSRESWKPENKYDFGAPALDSMRQGTGDEYGNVTKDEAAQGHANNLMTKYKDMLASGTGRKASPLYGGPS